MKRQRKNPAKKTAPAKKAAKPTRRGKISVDSVLRATIKGELRDRAKQIPLAARLAAAEQKAARLEEENVKFAKELIRWQDTVKLRDEAIGRKEKQIKELQEKLDQVAGWEKFNREMLERREAELESMSVKLLDLEAAAEMQGGEPKERISYRAILEAEVKARKAAQEQLRLATKSQDAMQRAYNDAMGQVGEFLRLFKPAMDG